MEIHAIKQQLTLAKVLDHYNLTRQALWLNCPFHDDKTSNQVYYKTQTCYCFSTNCPLTGASVRLCLCQLPFNQ